jgi:hypothetical protein
MSSRSLEDDHLEESLCIPYIAFVPPLRIWSQGPGGSLLRKPTWDCLPGSWGRSQPIPFAQNKSHQATLEGQVLSRCQDMALLVLKDGFLDSPGEKKTRE